MSKSNTIVNLEIAVLRAFRAERLLAPRVILPHSPLLAACSSGEGEHDNDNIILSPGLDRSGEKTVRRRPSCTYSPPFGQRLLISAYPEAFMRPAPYHSDNVDSVS